MARAVSSSHGELALRLLAQGEMEVLSLMPRASNYTFLTRVHLGDDECQAVYKPRDGEAPLWDFPDGTLCKREVAAYVVSASLGWPSVPPTVLRDGPEGIGSAQLFVDFDPRHHFFTLQEQRADDFRRVAVFDAIVNNADRKGGHCLLGKDGRIHVIDHGVCFSSSPKLRTVIWDFAGDPIPDELLGDVARLEAELRDGPTRAALGGLLDPIELDATHRRTAAILRSKRFPLPGNERPYPWPAV
jgi:uncharacterized repeat protein (TIGR03843 family)